MMATYRFSAHSGYCPHCGERLRRADEDIRKALTDDGDGFDERYEYALDLELDPEPAELEEPDDERYEHYSRRWDYGWAN